jgi:DNA-binding transcriptional LysR family regulator
MNPTNQFYYKNNRLQQLRGFCYAAQFGNITKAAHYMGLTHSSVSLQIKTLEEELGVNLFNRNGPRIQLSPQGTLLYDIAIVHIEGINKLHDTFSQKLESTKENTLHIAANNTALNFILPALLKSYLAHNPDMHITVHYAEHQDALQKLFDDTVELAILPRRDHLPFPQSCNYIPLFFHEAALITRPDHPLAGKKNLTIGEISAYELSLPAEDLRVIPNLYDIFPKHQIDKKLRINFVNWETTRRYIEEGLVISISSDVIIGKNDSLMATPLPHLFPSVDYGFVVKRDREIPAKIATLIALARSPATSQ